MVVFRNILRTKWMIPITIAQVIILLTLVGCWRIDLTLSPARLRQRKTPQLLQWPTKEKVFTAAMEQYVSDKFFYLTSVPVSIYMFKVNNRNTRTRCEISAKYSVSVVNFQQVNAEWGCCCNFQSVIIRCNLIGWQSH